MLERRRVKISTNQERTFDLRSQFAAFIPLVNNMSSKLLLAMSAVVAVSANQAPVISEVTAQLGASSLPTVFMHGMGDSCFNAG